MQSILARLRDTGQPLDILGLHGASTAFLLSRAVEALQRPLCCIVPADDQLEVLARDIAFFSRVPVLTYPSYEIPPYTPLSPDPATVCARLATLHRLHDNQAPAIVLTSAEAVLRRVLPAVELDRRCELVLAGEETDRDALIASLVASGYRRSSRWSARRATWPARRHHRRLPAGARRGTGRTPAGSISATWSNRSACSTRSASARVSS